MSMCVCARVSVCVGKCAVWLRNFKLNAFVSGVDNYDDDYLPYSPLMLIAANLRQM